MNQGEHPTKLAPEPSGTGKEVGWFKQIIRNLRERTIRGGPGIRVSYRTDCTLLELEKIQQASGGSGSLIKRCQITSVTPTGSNSKNYLTTREYNSDGYTLSTNVLLVAIPYFLRASTYEAQTIGNFIYTTVGGQIRCRQSGAPASAYIVETFFPPYIVGQDVYAMQPVGKTDVTVDDELLLWMDVQIEGRRLKPQQTQLSVCVLEGGVPTPRTITVEGGPVS